jgi:small subunit ribosomal protein S20
MALRKKSGIEESRKAIKRREHNRYFKTSMRTAIKKAIEVAGTETEDAAIRNAYKAIDKCAQKNIIHKNKAANRKSKMIQAIKKSKV